jgi:hypothetical protein
MLFLFPPNGLDRLNRWLNGGSLSGFTSGVRDLLNRFQEQI